MCLLFEASMVEINFIEHNYTMKYSANGNCVIIGTEGI